MRQQHDSNAIPTGGYFPPQAQPPQKKPDQPKKQRPHINPWRLLILLVCVGVMVFCVVALARYFGDAAGAAQVSRQLREEYQQALAQANTDTLTDTPAPRTVEEIVPTAAPQTTAASTPAPTLELPDSAYDAASERTRLTAYPDNPKLTVSSHFTSLRKRNDDIVGWLTIEGLLDEAVVQRDNEYYLTRDYLGYHNVTGALFLDEGCKLKQVPEQLVVHGHNMKTGAMFGCLKKYKVKGSSFLRENPYIRFDTLYESATYVIFAVLEADCRPEESMFFDFISHPTFATDEAFAAYVARAKLLSMYKVPLEVAPSDRLLTLATCSGTNEDTRLLVMARMLRPDEDEIELNKALYSITSK